VVVLAAAVGASGEVIPHGGGERGIVATKIAVDISLK
jgi:hypothetical protein